MSREKVVGENFRDGSMEVAFEPWTEQSILSRLQRRFPPLSGEVNIGIYRIPVLKVSAELFLKLGGTTDITVRPKRLLRAIFCSIKNLLINHGYDRI